MVNIWNDKAKSGFCLHHQQMFRSAEDGCVKDNGAKLLSLPAWRDVDCTTSLRDASQC